MSNVGETLPGYDAWKLAEPPYGHEDERECYVVVRVEINTVLDVNDDLREQGKGIAAKVQAVLRERWPALVIDADVLDVGLA